MFPISHFKRTSSIISNTKRNNVQVLTVIEDNLEENYILGWLRRKVDVLKEHLVRPRKIVVRYKRQIIVL